MATVDIHYVDAVLQCAVRHGKSSARLMAEVGISQETLQQPGAVAHEDQMTRLVQLVWAELGDEFMGCTEHPCKPGAFAFMARHVLRYETLRAVLEQGIVFYNLFTDDLRMRLHQRGGVIELEVVFTRPELDPQHFYQEFWLVIWHRFMSWVIGKPIPLNQVGFSYPKPINHRELKLLFPCRHRFNRPCMKLSFSAALLALPPVRTQRELSRFLKNSPADLITIPGEEASYRARIRSGLLHQGAEILLCPSFDALAEQFNVSSQTLRRKLNSEGTSYPRIKDEIRRDLAIEKLVSQKQSVTEVARLLGFSEPRSFSRAFKSWTGLTPSAYLQSLGKR
ncbi:MAG: AraC family transcriptional regulator [Motiliproteus sp.]